MAVFYGILCGMCKCVTIAHILEYFYAACEEENIAAMTGCTQGFAPIALERKIFVRHLGFFRGNNNTAAVHLYEKLGFKEIKRVKAPKGSGVNFFLYMRKEERG